MRLRSTLLQIAVLASSAGCGASVASSSQQPDASGEGGGTDASREAGEPDACGGCGCNTPAVGSGNASPEQACQITQQMVTGDGFGPACNAFCKAINDGGGGFFCTVAQPYVTAYEDAQPDGGDAGSTDAGADAGLLCPAWSGEVVVQCGYECLGRRTEGLGDRMGPACTTTGAVLAERAYLEAVSIHAFARLERELSAHGAPPALLREARRARRDEVRHTAMMTRLARRHAGTARLPRPLPVSPPRTLFAIALENAVEGCVRETYGAVVGLVEARTSCDPGVRRAMASIAADECRHAELAWALASWLRPRLSEAERAKVDRAKEETVAALRRDGDARLVGLLASRVWGHA